MKLEIDKDRVISAAEVCPEAKQTLKTLFPEVFEDTGLVSFREKLEKFLNYDIDYKIFERIPGESDVEKADHIIKLLRSEMLDWFDTDSRHPANSRSAEFYSETKLAQIEDSEGETKLFLVTADYKVDELGVHLERFDYWPHLPAYRESIEEFLRN